MTISNLTAEIKLKNNVGEFIDGVVAILEEFDCSPDMGRRFIALINENVIIESEEDLLRNLIKDKSFTNTPDHYKYAIGIGEDNTAFITMENEAYKELMNNE